MKHFLENYQFYQKSGNDAYNKGLGGHVICVIMTHSVRKRICDSPLTRRNIIKTKCGFKSVRAAGAIIRKELPNESKEAPDLNISDKK